MYFKKRLVIHNELDFAWAGSPIEMLNSCNTLHYTGVVDNPSSEIFRKTDFQSYTPFNQDLSGIDKDSASYFVRDIIDKYNQSNKSKRQDLSDVTFLLPVDSTMDNQLEGAYVATDYLDNNFDTHIILKDYGSSAGIDKSKLPNKVVCETITDGGNSNTAICINQLIKGVQTPYLVIWSVGVILPVTQINAAVAHLRSNQYPFIKPYNMPELNVDMLLREIFFKIRDANLFEENKNKMRERVPSNNLDVIFINKSIVSRDRIDGYGSGNIIENLPNASMLSVEGHIYYLNNIACNLL